MTSHNGIDQSMISICDMKKMLKPSKILRLLHRLQCKINYL